MILVDGYNLIGQAAGRLSGLSLEGEREKLVRSLEQISAVGGERFLVVFDASLRPSAASSRAESRNPRSAVSVVFSKPGQSADDWILKYLERRPKNSALLVTGDRELARQAKKLGFRVEPDLSRLEAGSEPHLSQAVTPPQTGGGLFSSLSRPSREALAQARKKARK